MKVRTHFEGGRIELGTAAAGRASLRIPHDVGALSFRQHFAFDLVGVEPGSPLEISLENAGDCTWADAFGGPYQVYVSEDREQWARASTSYDGRVLRVVHVPAARRCRFAYTPPYPSARLERVLRRACQAGARHKLLGRTPGGRPIDELVFGSRRPGARELWVIAQQHPGEGMAGWFVEGFIEALLDEVRRVASQSASRAVRRRGGGATRHEGAGLLSSARVHLVPRMNPDGVAAGNHRTTPYGVDLNRAWAEPSPPLEIRAVRTAMEESGVHLLVDVHGDERLPWVFVQAADDYPGRPVAIAAEQQRLERALCAASADFQTTHRYPYAPAGEPNLQLASNWAQKRFGCLAVVLEMPFSDNAGAPDARGWHPGRSKALGRAVVGALAAMHDCLRAS